MMNYILLAISFRFFNSFNLTTDICKYCNQNKNPHRSLRIKNHTFKLNNIFEQIMNMRINLDCYQFDTYLIKIKILIYL